MEIRLKGTQVPSRERIKLIESLVKQEKFAQALREIQKLESHLNVDFSPGEEGDIYYLASLCLYNLGRYKEALAKAMIVYETSKNSSENNKVARIQNILGRINLGLGDLKNAELHASDAISTYRRTGDLAVMVNSYNLIARICFMKCDFEKCVEYLNEAKEISEKVDELKMVALIQGNLGRVYTLLGYWREAEKNLEISLCYNQKEGNELGLCRDLLSLGFVSFLRRNFQRSKSFLARALELAQKNDFLRELGIYYEYAGQLAHSKGNEKQAYANFLKALEIGQTIYPSGYLKSQTYRLLAEIQVDHKEFDQAFISCKKSLEASVALREKIEEGAAYRILGQIYSAKGEKGRSREYFQKSVSLLQQIGAKYELARAYLETGRSESFDYYKRLGFLSNAESLFRNLNSKYHLGLVNLAVANLLVEQKDYRSAQVFLTEAERLFRESNDRKELLRVANSRSAIEEALFQSRMIAKSNGRVTFDNVVTKNTEMREIIEKLKQIKDYDISILLEGETGTGKDLLAKAIHYSSRRKDKRFVAVNCAALPESLLENELFGHTKGAYTGADKDQPGLFEEAEGGTLYLDQVEEIPMPTQVKLLRAIEEKEINRLGETKPRKIDVRIISSSIDDLKAAVKNEKFRQDLYFRLNTFDITIPPLRDRKEDIPLLVRHFLKEYKVQEVRIREFERNGTIKKFLGYDWPGNVRELDNEIKRIVVLAQAGDKDPCGFLSEKLDHSTSNEVLSNEASLSYQLAEFEKEKIIEALRQANWVKLRAARLLGIPEGTLRSKLKKYKIFPPTFASQNLN